MRIVSKQKEVQDEKSKNLEVLKELFKHQIYYYNIYFIYKIHAIICMLEKFKTECNNSIRRITIRRVSAHFDLQQQKVNFSISCFDFRLDLYTCVDCGTLKIMLRAHFFRYFMHDIFGVAQKVTEKSRKDNKAEKI